MSATVTHDATTRFAIAHADRCLVLSHRLQQCVTHAPQLEEELALANIALDLLGQARVLYSYAADRLGTGSTEDDMAFRRGAGDFLSPLLVEQPNTDFAAVMVRQLLHDVWAVELWRSLTASTDRRLADLAGKAVKETGYHVMHASEWVVVLGDSTDEAHRRTQSALDALWPFVDQLFDADETTDELVAAGVVAHPGSLRARWDQRLDPILSEATLVRPTPASAVDPTRSTPPTARPELAAIIDEIQQVTRELPGAQW